MGKNLVILVLILFAGSVFTTLSAADPGDLLWSGTLAGEGYTWSTPIAVNGRVYVQDQDNGGITCFHAATGNRNWYRRISPFGSVSSPVYRNGWIIMFGDHVYKVNATTARTDKVFTLAEGEWVASKAPAASDTTVFFSTNTSLYAVDLAGFTQVWKKPIGNANVIVSGNILYVMADKVYALNTANGTEHWNIPSPNISDPEGYNMGAVLGDSLAVFSAKDLWGDGTTKLWVYTLNPIPTVAPAYRWHASMGTQLSDDSPPVIQGGRVFANTRTGVLTAFSLYGAGTPLWTQTVRGTFLAPALPVALDGNVYTQEDTGGGSLQAVCRNGGTGAVVWQSSKAGGMGISWAQPTLYNNMVIIATDGDGVQAFEAGTVSGSWHMIQHNPALTGSDSGWTPEPPFAGAFCGTNPARNFLLLD